MSHNAPPIRTIVLSRYKPITTLILFSRTLSRQILLFILVQSQTVFLTLHRWESRWGRKYHIPKCLQTSKFPSLINIAYQKLAIRKIVAEREDIFVNLPTETVKPLIYQALPFVFPTRRVTSGILRQSQRVLMSHFKVKIPLFLH